MMTRIISTPVVLKRLSREMELIITAYRLTVTYYSILILILRLLRSSKHSLEYQSQYP